MSHCKAFSCVDARLSRFIENCLDALLSKFIDAYCHDPNDDEVKKSRTLFKDIYNAFNEWHKANICDCTPKKQLFGLVLAKRFNKKESGGQVWFYGVKLKHACERE